MTGPRRCWTWEEFDAEVERQKKLVAKGWLRHLVGTGRQIVTAEWTQGELSNGQRCWLWASGGTQLGGVWANADDAAEAFKLAEFEWEALQA